MTPAELYFTTLIELIPDAQPGKMFGALCMKMPNGKSGAMFWKDHLVVRLQGKEMEMALALSGARIFEPMEGRPMNGWVQVPFAHKNKWMAFAKQSAATAALLEKKPAKKKK
ncbi:hypothetical protein [Niabella soli]|uniref:TfoX N-terminal domain-containing protein n=1 Tax=Niabella soli DSM 19437 TaxID=929713 RepID=W0F8W8_9BACT|nr:hypothetical protein [Niabella soli]AHF17919.1 hypothetical protein NIASO_16655 [Niabella soli DSM 19437]